ncbi:AcrR family transcriptional regulator [Kaistia hirudinis]|uniref:AcrR family transcriptional regulator n=1 Tax=Kaistia hirudinis TaxID=1293440 RepID=A0A840ATK4_9HYPH|nr:CerR family C-terminal domain-containing protein [Kaistia hirudinis]MBB3932151.1 AcrR family transcriptional regulator [Kaistia hirudinis]
MTIGLRDDSADVPLRGSRHYRRAQQDRGTETRQRLLLAALDAFGRYGFDGASTREIARRADANLAAIVYHFGSKEALHLAVAEYVVAQMRAKKGDLLIEIDARLDAGDVDKATVRRLLQRVVDIQVETMLGDREVDLWGRFLMREQMEPSPVFDVTFSYMMQGHRTMRRLVALLLDQREDDPAVAVRVFTLLGQVVMFCVAQPMVMRSLGKQEFGMSDRELIRRIATENIDRIGGVPLVGDAAG